MTTRPESSSRVIDLDRIVDLYHRYAQDLYAVRTAQRHLLASTPALRPKLDDIEAEITYLLVRDARPEQIVEIGSFRGWSTTWLLRALLDNGTGRLRTYDIVDHARYTVPDSLSSGRWAFHHGDVRTAPNLDAPAIDYLFVDAAHTPRFARWYTRAVLDDLQPGTVVSVHDVYHRHRPGRYSEGRVVLDWLTGRQLTHFTASREAAPFPFEEIRSVRRRLGMGDLVHQEAPNPMIYFTAP